MQNLRKYRIRLLGPKDSVVGERLFYGDELAALLEALKHCEDQAVEVWQGGRRVAGFEKGCEMMPGQAT